MKMDKVSEVPTIRTQDRIEYLDIFRCFGIVAMIMGHIGFGSKFDFVIHAFHMPMFFWVSGYLFNHRSKEELSFLAFVRKKARALLVPYFFFGIAHWIVYAGGNYLTHHVIPVSPLLSLFTDNTDGLAICGALWFLSALFFTDILFFLIDRTVGNNALKTMIVILITLIGHFEMALFAHPLPWALGQSFVGVGLYYLGFLFKKYRNQKVLHSIMNLSWLPSIILGIITVILIFMNGYVNTRTRNYAIIPLFWINVTLSVIVLVNIARLVFEWIRNTRVCDYLTSIGRDSIVYVCLNQIVILFFDKVLNMVNIPYPLQKITILIAVLFTLRMVDIMMIHTPLKVIIGKK